MGMMKKSNIEMEIMRFIQKNFKKLNFVGDLKDKKIIAIPKESGSVSLQSEYEGNGIYEFNGGTMIAVKNGDGFAEEYYFIRGEAELKEGEGKIPINIINDIYAQKC